MGRADSPISVIVVDDHRSFGEALQMALDKERDIRVTEVLTDADSALKSVGSHPPDVVLLDLQMPGIDGLEATRRIRRAEAKTAVIIITGRDDDISLGRAIQAGAQGFIRKTENVKAVADAIRRASRGEPLLEEEEVERSLGKLRRQQVREGDIAARLDRLTPRELQIIQRLADGRSSEEIAEELGMSKHTVRTHTQNILTKLGVHSKLDAIVAAIRHGKVTSVTLEEVEETEPAE